MMRLMLLVLLASVSSCTLLDEDTKSLEGLEDLLLRDGNMREYSTRWEGRTPTNLLKFNSASESPGNKAQLRRYLKMLQDKDNPVSRMLSAEAIERSISQIRSAMGRRSTCLPATAPYRTIDGTCNNLAETERGAIDTPLIRLVPNAYNDGLSQPRTQSVIAAAGALPSARAVSIAVFGNRENVIPQLTALTMHFGQITDHDLTAVHSQSGVDCSGCSQEGECFSIPIGGPIADPVFGGVQPCFDFVRSEFETDAEGVRQHANTITTYLDASFVYGSNEADATELKDTTTGFMKHDTDQSTSRPLLPPNRDFLDCAGYDSVMGIFCGKAGDSRAAEQPGLTSLHTLFLREHNRIADTLTTLSPSLSPEQVYQKARKIVGAEWQHILYNEYLPLLVGVDLYESNHLQPDAPYTYDSEVDASISNIFAAAAFRFGHTLVPKELTRASNSYKTKNLPKIKMAEAFFNGTYIYDTSIPKGAVDSILRGMTIQDSELVDGQFSEAITENLFGDPDVVGDGFDLTALNIQRARDHGIPSYVTIRKDVCEFVENEINEFADLFSLDIMKESDADNLKDAYGHPNDIDAFVGFVLEKALPNTLVGPTLACIFADQFRRLKFGDRFFYLNQDQFSLEEIAEIKKATMARLMCDNVEAVNKIQPYVLIKEGNYQNRRATKRYDSFHEYSRSGNWPNKRDFVLDGLDNRRQTCSKCAGKIPVVDIAQFV